jgi:hypothetical protein
MRFMICLRNRNIYQPAGNYDNFTDGFAFEPGLDLFGGESGGFDFFLGS